MRRLAWVTAAALVTGCGASAPPQTPGGAKTLPAATRARASSTTNDLAAVPAPAELTMTARFADPAATRRALVVLFGKSFPLLEGLTPERVAAFAAGEPVADVLDLSRPVDIAGLKIDGKAEYAAAAAMAHFEESKKDLAEDFKLAAPASDGAIALEPLSPSDKSFLRACEIRPAFGDAPYRMVCASSRAALDVAGPYLARTAPRTASSSQLHIEVPITGVGATSFAFNLKAGGKDDLSEKFGRDVAMEAFRDVSNMALDGSITPDGAKVGLDLKLAKATSPLGRMGLALVRDAKPLPDTFWRLPADADAAFYTRGVARAEYGSLRGDLLAILRDGIAKEGPAPGDVDRIMGLFDRVFMTGGPLLFAHGFDAEAARDAVNAAAPSTDAKRHAEAEALAGWALFAVDEPPATWTAALNELIDIVHHADTTKANHPKDWKPEKKVGLVPIPARAGLPQGALHLEARDLPKPPAHKDEPAPYPSSDHVFVVPDGARTWIAIGHSDARIIAKLRVAMGIDKAATLKDRGGLDSLHAASTGFAGFVTVSAFASSDAPSTPPQGSDRGNARKLLDHVHELPEHGTTPIPFVLGGHAEGHGGDVSFQVDLPRAAIAAIVAESQSSP
jgi:hypothetical protein